MTVGWAASVAAGGMLTLLPHPSDRPIGLTPQTVARYLARVPPHGVRDVRVNGIYGSGHAGAWQIVAHLTWRTAAGDIGGAVARLPYNGGEAPLTSPADPATFPHEERIGWTLARLRDALAALPDTAAPLAMLELNIYPDGTPRLTACSASSTAGAAHCVQRTGPRLVRREFIDELTDQPDLQELSVQRRSDPVTIATGP